MHILYGVQATGNGHITRARTMSTELQRANLQVDYLFSGRDPEKLFNMEPFGNYRCYRGLTFVTSKGQLRHLQTLQQNNLSQFIKDVRALDLSPYDLVITDFEPITAWAARLQKIQSVGIGHQYAFMHDIPKAEHSQLIKFIMKEFAPADQCLGVHWHHYNNTILPPLIEAPKYKTEYIPNKILVYLPFDDTEDVVKWLRQFPVYNFHIYCDQEKSKIIDHLHLYPFSRDQFQRDLANCSGVIANAGFGLASEAIQYGKKLLVKPLIGQMEQLSNAEALLKLRLGDVVQSYNNDKLRQWLSKPNPRPVIYPNVAKSLVDWIQAERQQPPEQLAKSLWRQTIDRNIHPN